MPGCCCRLECAKALLRAGADPNYANGASDLTLFWGIDGGERAAAAAAAVASLQLTEAVSSSSSQSSSTRH